MRLHELLEARVEPDQDFLAQLEEIVDESIAEYQEFLEENNDVDVTVCLLCSLAGISVSRYTFGPGQFTLSRTPVCRPGRSGSPTDSESRRHFITNGGQV